jgi:hypothetical protein
LLLSVSGCYWLTHSIRLDGEIAHVTDTPSADTHLSEMKEAVEKLNKS